LTWILFASGKNKEASGESLLSSGRWVGFDCVMLALHKKSLLFFMVAHNTQSKFLLNSFIFLSNNLITCRLA